MIINLFDIDESIKPKDHIKYLKIDLDFLNSDSVELVVPLNMTLPNLENQFMKFNEFEYQLYKIPIIKITSSIDNYFILKFIIKLSKKCRCFDNKSIILYQYETTEITLLTAEYLNIFIEKALRNIYETGICNNCKNVDCICKVNYLFDKKELEDIDKCPICQEYILNNNFYCCKNIHKIHYHCFSILRLKNRCPVCKIRFNGNIYCNDCIEDSVEYL
jgi:hypothetical protein